MSVAFPITTAASVSAASEAPRSPSLWELGAELQSESRWIAQLAERLHTGDDEDHALAVADLEQSLAAEEHQREALQRKADATCWVIGRLRGDASYHQEQAKRFTALAKSEASRQSGPELPALCNRSARYNALSPGADPCAIPSAASSPPPPLRHPYPMR